MIDLLLYNVKSQLQALTYLILIMNGILHLIFAGAVARDAGLLHKRNCPTILVSGVTWSFATLVGGVIVATIYWLLHHSTLTIKKS